VCVCTVETTEPATPAANTLGGTCTTSPDTCTDANTECVGDPLECACKADYVELDGTCCESNIDCHLFTSFLFLVHQLKGASILSSILIEKSLVKAVRPFKMSVGIAVA
jgi:hypothetical protein